MVVATNSYNPGFLTDDELEEMFCVRIGEFESILETLRENIGESNQHVMVIGPRGSGKTTLLLRVALEVRSDPELSSRLHPILFAEESYAVSTCGEFWLESLSRLAQQAPHHAEGLDLRRTVKEVRRERDDRVLRERCLGALLHFAELEGKRLVLQVENLNMLFSDMVDPNAGWCLRKTLQTEPQIMMVGSATNRFGEIDRPDRALYDLFRVLTLQPLDRNESAVLCGRVSGRDLDDGLVRRLQILTGGSPRLLAIVARFGAARSFRTLLSDLLDLVDEHTAYFKSHLESLPSRERRVYLALAELWRPATAREVAERARMETSNCSAQLRRLTGRGAVSDAGGTDRRKQYHVSERLYNTYYLLRRSRGMDSLVGALVQFMDAYYSRAELQGIVDDMVAELRAVDPPMRLVYQLALEQFSTLPELAWHFYQEYPQHVPDDVRAVTEEASALLERGRVKFENGDLHGALMVLEDLLTKFGKHIAPTVQHSVARALVNKSTCLRRLERTHDAIAVCDHLVANVATDDSDAVAESVATALFNRGQMLGEVDRAEDALAAYDELQNRFGSSELVGVVVLVADGQANKAVTLFNLKRWDDALEVCEEIWDRFGNHKSSSVLQSAGRAMTIKSAILSVLGRTSEHLAACRELLSQLDRHDRQALIGEVADYDAEAVVSLRLRTWEIRALTYFKEGDAVAAAEDVRAILSTLPHLATMPTRTIRFILIASVALGADRIASLIRESPSVRRLLPLSTALELDMGGEPRVAIEVREVAEDMRAELGEIREQMGVAQTQAS